MRVGVARSGEKDSFVSGKNIAEAALKNGGISRADFVLAFCSSDLDAQGVFNGIQSVVGDVPIIGGSALGIVANDGLSYAGFSAGAAIIQSETMRSRLGVVGHIDKDSLAAGKNLGLQFGSEPDDRLMLMFYDSLKQAPTDSTPLVMNSSSPLLKGLQSNSRLKTPVFGAGLVGDFSMGSSHQFCGSCVDSQTLVGMVLSGDFDVHYRIMHGCSLYDGEYHTITKKEGSCVYEVDGKPIVEIMDEIYDRTDWRKQRPVNLLALGINYGEKYGEFAEANYVNRLIVGNLPDKKGVVLFEPDLEEGTEFQFMVRDNATMIDSARLNSAEILAQVHAEGKRAAFGLYIDCGGRTVQLANSGSEEADEVRRIFNQWNVPLFGFYSGVEIAPFLGKSRGLDLTGVLVVIAEKKAYGN